MFNSRGYQDKRSIHEFVNNYLAITLMGMSLVASSVGFAMDVSVKPISEKLRIQSDETKWISLGAGIRGTGLWVENQRTGNLKGDFVVDNARLYLNGQFHKYLKFEVNSECFFCPDPDRRTHNILDAVAKFEFNRYFNVWGGRMLVPTERGELNGPYFHATHDGFKTPFFPQDFSIKFGNGGAGRYGRDDGATLWGSVEPGFMRGTFSYAAGVYRGLQSAKFAGPNQGGSVLTAARFTYNFLNPEKNPGYYTAGTYYGKAGDVLALAYGLVYQRNGAGSFNHRSDFVGMVGDVLFEKVLPDNMGLVTLNGEFKQFYANYSTAAFADPDCFCIFNGKSWTVTGLYMVPIKIGIGNFQPYGRFTSVQPDRSSNRDEIEAGLNYIIDGFNARISAYYQHGDLFTKGLNYAPDVRGPSVDIFKISFQLQI